MESAYCVTCHNPIRGTQVLVNDGIATKIKDDPSVATSILTAPPADFQAMRKTKI